MSDTLAGELTDEHVGMRVLGIESIAGWAPHLLLMSVSDRDGDVELMFRWDDDPSPANSRRGQFAIGVTIPSDSPITVAAHD